MANSINWGVVYCITNFGNQDDMTNSIQQDSKPTCFN